MISIDYINKNYICSTCKSSNFHAHAFEPIVYCNVCKDAFLIDELQKNND
jgi:ribosomal protein L37AE/L43A